MNRLSFVELMAVLFAGIAGLASALQAYVSWETRGEVSRAIVFSERIDACAQVIAAIEPFVAKARPEGRAVVAGGQSGGRYSLPAYYYGQSSGNAAFRSKHDPRIEKLRVATAALLIVGPGDSREQVEFFDNAIAKDIGEGRFMNQGEMLSWLEQLEGKAEELVAACRALL